jgi:heme a synthase
MSFRKFVVLTIIAVYLLIFVGGVVRSTGSGMGCPDWPKCFGLYIPPTSVEQLPLNYQEIYGKKLKGEVNFNPVKTWIEYLNRLLGALIGILVFVTFLYSLRYWKSDIILVIYSAIVVILTGFQGWVGSKVVSSELAGFMVTTHMIIAIMIVAILLFIYFRSNIHLQVPVPDNLRLNKYLIALMTLTFVQVIFGTQVREGIDIVSKKLGETDRNLWVENIGLKFFIHRSFSIIVLVFNLLLFLKIRKFIYSNASVLKYNYYLLGIIFTEIFTGISLAYLNFPAFVQPFHLTLAIVALGFQLLIFFAINASFFKKMN